MYLQGQKERSRDFPRTKKQVEVLSLGKQGPIRVPGTGISASAKILSLMCGPKAESHHTVRQQYHGDCDQRDMRDPSLPPNSKQKPLKFLRNLEREKSQQ